MQTNRPIEVQSSVADSAALALILSLYFELPGAAEVELFSRGTEDCYRVWAEGAQYFFKLYHEARDFEGRFAALESLRAAGVHVVLPYKTKEGAYSITLQLPEGKRCGVLYEPALGECPSWPSVKERRALGRSLAEFHLASSEEKGIEVFDALKVLEESAGLCSSASEKEGNLQSLVSNLRASLKGFSKLPSGLIHGDFHPRNVRFQSESVAFIDLDYAASGPFVWDLASLLWSVVMVLGADEKEAGHFFEDFLEAYQQKRPLSEDERSALSSFVQLRELWAVSLLVSRRKVIGTEATSAEKLDERLRFLEEIAERPLYQFS